MADEQFHDEISYRHVRGVPRELISDRDLRFTDVYTTVAKPRVARGTFIAWCMAHHSNHRAIYSCNLFVKL
jgi:hypothetical protein